MPSFINHASAGPQHKRSLNQTWEETKEIAGQTYEGFKNTVTKNMVLSITLSVTVIALLILCCYLRRKCSRDAQVISRKEYNNLVATREERNENMKQLRETQKNERRRRRRSKKKGREPHSKHLVGTTPAEGTTDVEEGGDGNLANLSMNTTDTRDTSMSRDDVDIEIGDDGAVELEFNADHGNTRQEI